jgi:hypothetical protein
MRQAGLARFAPLKGVVFVALIVIAIVVGGETPDNDDSQRAIVDFWQDNEGSQFASTLIGAWAVVFFLWFAGSVRATLRRVEEGPARLSALSFGGAIVGAVGLLISLGLAFAAVDSVDDVPADVTQTLTILGNELFFPIAVGLGVFFMATGLLAVRTRALPVAIAWLAVAIGVLCITPVGFIALLAGLVWILLVSVLLYRRESGPAARPADTGPTASTPV